MDGTFIKAYATQRGKDDGQLYQPPAVCLTLDGDLVVIDSYNDRIQIFHVPSFKFKLKFSSAQTNEVGSTFRHAFGLNVDILGNILLAYYYSHHIQVFLPDGTFIKKIEKPTIVGELERKVIFAPTGLAVDPRNGNIVCCDPCNARIEVLDPSGKNTLFFIGSRGVGQLNCPSEVVVAGDGTICVTDQKSHCVQLFSPEGKFLMKMGTKGSGDGELFGPQGIQLAPDGSIVVCDCNNHRILVFG